MYTLKWPLFYIYIFPAEQTLQLLFFRVKGNRKNTNKMYGASCQVQPIFETLAPRLMFQDTEFTESKSTIS